MRPIFPIRLTIDINLTPPPSPLILTLANMVKVRKHAKSEQRA